MAEANENDEADDEQDDENLGATSQLRTSNIAENRITIDPSRAFNIIVANLRHVWMELGYRLGLSYVEINAIDLKCRGDTTIACREVLWQWLAISGREATWMQLQRIVSQAGHKDVSEKLQKEKGYFNQKYKKYVEDAMGMIDYQFEFRSKSAGQRHGITSYLHDHGVPMDVTVVPYQSKSDDMLLSREIRAMLFEGYTIGHSELYPSIPSIAIQDKSNEQYGRQGARSPEVRALRAKIKSLEEENKVLKMRKYIKDLEEENERLKRELGPARDSGISTATKSSTSSSANVRSLAKAQNKVVLPIKDTIAEVE